MKILFFLFLVLWPLQPGSSAVIVLDRILAVVNGEVISLSDVESDLFYFSKVEPPPQRDLGGTLSDSAIRTGIRELINQKLLLAEAKRFDVEDPTERQIDHELEIIQNRFPSPAAFEMALRRNAMTPEDLRQRVKEHLRVNRFVDQRIRFFVILLPEEISQYYSENQGKFQHKTYEEAEKEIEMFLTEAKAKGKLEAYLSNLKTKASIQINFE